MIFMWPGNTSTDNDCVIDVDDLPRKTMFIQTLSDSSFLDRAIDMVSRILFEWVYVINSLNAFSAWRIVTSTAVGLSPPLIFNTLVEEEDFKVGISAYVSFQDINGEMHLNAIFVPPKCVAEIARIADENINLRNALVDVVCQLLNTS